jgi:lysozyme family protein
MQVDYKPFVDRLIQKYEGGYCWDRGDPGGPTKYGITCYDLAAHRGQTMTSMSAWAPLVQSMTLAEAEDIYSTKYAAAVHFPFLPAGIDCVVMDYEVNSGTRGTLVANSLVGVAGSIVTPKSITLLNQTDPVRFINNMCDERLRFMHAIKGGSMWATFGRGWSARVADLRAYCLHIAANKPIAAAPPAPDLSKTPTPKAVVVSNAGKTAKVGAGAAGAAAATSAAGLPAWAWGTMAGIAVAGALGYGLYEAYQDAQANRVQL